jgi:hypothetical protein
MAFDGENFCGKFPKQRGNVTRAGSNLENFIIARELQRFEHDSDDVGLGNRLAVADRKRMIFVSLGTTRFRHKFVAGYPKHCVQDARIGDAPSAELGIDHQLPGSS